MEKKEKGKGIKRKKTAKRKSMEIEVQKNREKTTKLAKLKSLTFVLNYFIKHEVKSQKMQRKC